MKIYLRPRYIIKLSFSFRPASWKKYVDQQSGRSGTQRLSVLLHVAGDCWTSLGNRTSCYNNFSKGDAFHDDFQT